MENKLIQYFNLTSPQENIWLTEQLNQDTNINQIYGTLFIDKKMDLDLLKLAINRMIENNDALRIRIIEQNAKPMQYVADYEYDDIPVYFLEDDKSNKIQEIIDAIGSEHINILDNKLYDFRIIYCPHCVYLCVKMHHIIADAWSMAQLFVEHLDFFYKQVQNEMISEKKPSYLNYIEKSENYKNSEKYEKDRKFWEKYVKNLNCKNEFGIPKNKASKRIEKKLETSLYNKIASFCKENNITEYSFFLGILSTYFSELFSDENLVIGTPFLNRKKSDKEFDMMGMFVATLPLHIHVESSLSFIELCKQITATNMSCFKHSSFPYRQIQKEYEKFSGDNTNLYEIVFSYQMNNLEKDFDNTVYKNTWYANDTQANPLFISYMNHFGEHQLCYDYILDCFEEMDIDALHNRFICIIEQVLQSNQVSVDEIEIITPEEKHKILYEFNDTAADYPKDKTVVDLFEEQVEKNPNNIAVVFENEKLTYRELNEKANAIANFLIRNSIKKEDVIGIFLDKSLESIIAILGILKAGGAYLPIDISYPKSRIEYMISDSNAKFILSNSEFEKTLKINIPIINLNKFKFETKQNLNRHIKPNNLAYIMYTSGSTGNPKGVMVEHKNIIRLVKNTNFIKFGKEERILQTGSIVFDACTFEIWAALLNGFELYIITKNDLLDSILLQKYIETNKITILWLTSPLFNQHAINNPYMFKNVKYLLVGGDVLSPIHINSVKEKNPNLQIINGYGPTENTTFSTCFNINQKYTETIPIGFPIANSTCYVMSSSGNLKPINVPGELWVGGDGVSRGYLNNVEQTKDKFIDNFLGNGRIYKTGDLVKWLPDGSIEFIGRIDNQVKIRGFRIELSEIDRRNIEYPGIKQSFTTIQNINDVKTICSYIVSDEQIDITNLKNTLREKLPNYMIPTFIVQLKSFNLTVNGKIDKKSLPIPNMDNLKKNIIPTRNKIDELIINILNNMLDINNISIEDSFFDLGGDSLSAITFSSVLAQKLNTSIVVKDIFEHPIIKDLSDFIACSSKERENKIKITKQKDFYPLSSAQKRIYYASVIDNDSVLYNIAGGIIVDQKLDVALLEKCFNQLIERHEILRTHFNITNDEIVQIIEEKVEFHLTIENEIPDNLNDVYNDFVKPFDLSKAPLFRAKIVSLENNKMLLLLDMHHIISDGTSLSILLQELCDLYNEKPLVEKQIDYKDFTLWEKEQFEKEEFKNAKDFWVNQYQDEIPLLNLPTTFSRPSSQSFEGANFYTTLPKEIFEKVNEVAKKLEITPYMLMLSVYYILLSKYTTQDDIVVGTPIVGRELPELYNMLGMFVNTLALRNKVSSSASFKDFASDVKEYCLTAFQNQTYPFDELVKALNIKRDTSRNPLFDVMFVYQNNGYPSIDFGNTKVEYFIPDSKISKFDLSLEVIPVDGEFSLRFEYCTKLFDENFIKRFSMHYCNILNVILENSAIKISDIDMLSQEEKYQILHDFNDTYSNYPRNKTIVDLFEEQVKKNPNKIAVTFQDKKLTYSELNKRANGLAHTLISKGVQAGDIVGAYLERSLELIVSIFGTLKAGAVYMPMYTGYPTDRLTYMLKNSNAKFLITNRKLAKNMDYNIKKILVNNRLNLFDVKNPQTAIHPTDLAYCIYTSGSTGKPKGVKITHRNLINFVSSFNQYFNGITAKDTFLASTNISFDVSIWEIFMPLLNGAKLVLNTEEIISDITLYCDTIIKNKITALYIPPNILDEVYHLLSENKNVAINKLLVGVEAIRKSTLNKYYNLNSDLKIVNGYGPTETTICATALSYTKDESQDEFVSIGKPLNNNKIYILDANKSLCAVGIPGEIYISGDGVGNGYLNNPSETNKSFIKEPFPAYKTGDLAKWNEDGTIHFIGRNDNQIKLSGYRIELNEINSTILSYPNISKCFTTILKNKNNSYLVAYFVADNQIAIKDLKAYLQTKLTFYMIPKFFMQLETLPITINGKVDKKALPVPNFKTDVPYVAPRNDYEKKISKIVRKTTKHTKNQH